MCYKADHKYSPSQPNTFIALCSKSYTPGYDRLVTLFARRWTICAGRARPSLLEWLVAWPIHFPNPPAEVIYNIDKYIQLTTQHCGHYYYYYYYYYYYWRVLRCLFYVHIMQCDN